ncbi:hypothetical protein AMECASPLE_039089 [Ameca splendens]|uniref:Uncharacterized protein n=1 Tax=Ameca splendens TaxID=208324 RepID=A0ABV0YK65_9TELE
MTIGSGEAQRADVFCWQKDIKFNWIQSHTIIDHMQTRRRKRCSRESPAEKLFLQAESEGRTTAQPCLRANAEVS